MNRPEVQFLSFPLLAAIGLTTVFFSASFPLAAQQAAQGPACSEAALKAHLSGSYSRVARPGPGHVETMRFKTFEVSPARSAEGDNACAVHTLYTLRMESAAAIYERDREARYLCSRLPDGGYTCRSQGGRNVGERRDIWNSDSAATPTGQRSQPQTPLQHHSRQLSRRPSLHLQSR